MSGNRSVEVARSHAELLAVSAALSSPVSASSAWNELIETFGFDDLPNFVNRQLPRIYVNLRQLPSVPEFNRIRGAYKLNWARNVQHREKVAELKIALEQKSISFSVFKGAGVGMLTSNLSARVLGDIDLLIQADQAKLLFAPLKNLGYRLRDPSTPSSLEGLGAYAHPSGFVLDLHTWSSLPQWALQAQWGQSIGRWGDLELKTLSPEGLAVYALAHGALRNSESDFSQSLIDFALLNERCDSERLLDLLQSVGPVVNLEQSLDALEKMGILHSSFLDNVRWNSSRVEKVRRRLDWQPTLLKLKYGFKMIYKRRLKTRELSALAVTCVRHPSLTVYLVWSLLGRLQVLERGLRSLGINLASPAKLFESGGPLKERDFRVRHRAQVVQSGTYSVKVSMQVKENHPTQLQLFALAIDGKSYGYFPVDGQLSARYLVDLNGTDVEISLRPSDDSGECMVQSLQLEILQNPALLDGVRTP